MRFFGYIDPGTGSFAIQAVIGAVLGAGYVVRHRLKAIFSKFRKGSSPDHQDKA